MPTLSEVKREVRRSKRRRRRMAIIVLVPLAVISLLILIYLMVDSGVPRDYEADDSQSTTSYSKEGFIKLAGNIESGELTGIPSLDDSSLELGLKVDITKGVGDFASIKPNLNITTKSMTPFNGWRMKNDKSPDGMMSYDSKLVGPYLVNPYFLNEATTYLPSGVTKLFDRYVFVAVGTYWAEKFGLKTDRGATYRVYLDTGAVYDVIVVDTKGSGVQYFAPNNTTIAHASGNSLCVTEFYAINSFRPDRWPVVPTIGWTAGIDYSSALTIKDDPWKQDTAHLTDGPPNNFNTITDFKGEVIALQLIKDARVTELIESSHAQYKAAIDASRNVILKGNK